jgi:tryptophanyl-tRNA synthetase
MAADILLYDSDVVPVGRDQKQHVEVTRDIAIKINQLYGEKTLKLPTPRIKEETAAVPGTDGQKMSKSYGNILAIFEDEKPLRKKVMSIKTDSTPVEDPKEPEGSLIVELYKLVATAEQVEQMKADFRNGGVGYGDFKQRLFVAIWERFTAERVKRAELVANLDYVHQVLAAGAAKAQSVARPVIQRVRQAVGLSR